MEKIAKLGKGLILIRDEKKYRTIISVIYNDKETEISNVKKNGSNFMESYFCTYVTYNEHYIVSYTRGNMISQRPVNIEGAYSIEEHRLVNLKNDSVKKLIKNMLVTKKEFDLAEVLQEINKVDLGLLDDKEKYELEYYLTAGNKKISHEKVVKYILSKYPQLKEYTELKDIISVSEYRRIEKLLDNQIFSFHTMTQDIDFVESYKEELNKDSFMGLNLLENELQLKLKK